MVRFLVALWFSALLQACAPPDFPQLPNQTLASDLVWKVAYGEQINDPPRIQWIFQEKLNCGQSTAGQFRGFFVDNHYGDLPDSGTCVGGATWDQYNVSQIAWYDGATFSTTSIAHEYYHMDRLYMTGDPDGTHSGPGWKPGGVVFMADQILEGYGL